MKNQILQPVHPGEILMEEFLGPFAISQYRLAKSISVPPRRINEIVQGKRAVSVDTALRLGKYFSTSAEFWLNLQMKYDLENYAEKSGDKLNEEVQVMQFAS